MIPSKKSYEPKRSAPLTYHHRHIAVAFGDIAGFTHWTKSPLDSQSKFREKILLISKKFVNFQINNPFFVKRMGDGLMAVVELEGNRIPDQEKIISLIKRMKELNTCLLNTIQGMDFPRPQGFRSRIVAGDAIRIETFIRRRREFDYIGYAVNFAFNLLGVRPDIHFLAHETIKSLIDIRTLPLRAIPIAIAKKDYKGVDKEDLAALWDFDFEP